ncbi:ABC transporter ATP-binding protein [Paenibacillus sp. NPDC058071]|uniref:ABC transporter ATP-binding protein n=1 Tax=Paenibacillus sp. NPDC058071 TaxID=3346326 RepID=UPI0036D767BB
MSRGEAILSVRNVSKIYHRNGHAVRALNQVSFRLHKGEMLAVMGTSGSGKSTLLNILGTLDEPTGGEVTLQGLKPDKMFTEPHATHFRREHIGFVFQSFHLLKDLSVEENIALPLVLKGLSNKEIRRKVDQMLQLVGLTDWRAHRPVELSGGQQQRVGIGRALITSPPILLADEPTGNLDFNTSLDILNLLIGMKRELGQSIVLVTHDPTVAAYADRTVFFHDGTIVDELENFGRYRHEENMNRLLNKFRRINGEIQ